MVMMGGGGDYRPPVKSSVSKLHDRRGNSAGRTSPKASAHAGALSPPISSSPLESSTVSGTSSFERRMRDLVLGNQKRKPSTQKKNVPPNVHVVQNLQDYKRLVGDERTKLVAVRFYAPWCRACKAVAPLYYHLANRHPDMVFVDVPVTEQNAALHQGLGVPSLPFGHIYHPQAGLVEELKLTRKHIAAFDRKLTTYSQGYCDLPSEDDDNDSEDDSF